MRSFLLIVLLFLSPLSARAVTLCETQCKVLIEFPEGGSLHATEALTMTFGDNGLIDTVGGVTAFADGETLILHEGESIDFDEGGSFDIGEAGNIDYTSMEIATAGTIQIIAVGEPQAIHIEVLKVSGPATLMLSTETGTITINILHTEEVSINDLRIEGGGSLVVEAPDGEDTTCSLDSDSGIIIIGDSSSLVTGPAEACDLYSGGTLLPDDLAWSFPDQVISESQGPGFNSAGSNSGSIGFLHLFLLGWLFPSLCFRQR